MSKDNIAQQYNNMVASIEDAKIYDGRGEYNLYECNKCNNYKVTLYKDKGVTSFIMRCKCGGDMMHTKSSKQAPPSYVKVHNWVRPSLKQTMSLSKGMRINKNIMKKILLICTLLALLTGCTAPKVYKKNRFTKQFQEADSMFNEKYGIK